MSECELSFYIYKQVATNVHKHAVHRNSSLKSHGKYSGCQINKYKKYKHKRLSGTSRTQSRVLPAAWPTLT